MTITVFYSWQSNTPFNRKTIRDALRQAAEEVEQKIPGLTIKIDEATSNEVGTLHIPNAILQNIAKADIFVGDLTVIGESFDKQKRIANPNVLIEAGYAISELTWNRMILLFNKSTGTFPDDLPFDIDRRSCIDFKTSQENDTNAIGQLRVQLTGKIAAIIEKNPPRNLNSKTQAEVKQRTQDIETLRAILNLFRIKRMDHLFSEGHGRIDGDILRKIEDLDELTSSTLFHLFDVEAKSRLLDLQAKLHMLPELLKSYEKERGYSSYKNKAIRTPNVPNRFEPAKQVLAEIQATFTALLDHIRYNYHEIDIDKFYKYEDEDDS